MKDRYPLSIKLEIKNAFCFQLKSVREKRTPLNPIDADPVPITITFSDASKTQHFISVHITQRMFDTTASHITNLS